MNPVSKAISGSYLEFTRCFKTVDGNSIYLIRLAMFLIYYKLLVLYILLPSVLLLRQPPSLTIIRDSLLKMT
jgi:hypothetical protein